MVDVLAERVAVGSDRHGGDLRERRLELLQTCTRGLRPRMFVLREHELAVRVDDRNDRAIEVAVLDRMRGAALAFGAESRSEEHTSELQSLMRISYAVFCLKKKKKK